MALILDGDGSISGVDQGIAISGVTTFTGDIHLAENIDHVGDEDTRIRFPAADTFSVETAGSERLRIASDGIIRLQSDGSAANKARFEINEKWNNNATDFGIDFKRTYDSGGDDQDAGFIHVKRDGGASNDGMVFAVGDQNDVAERLRIDSSGNVGINSTSPERRLDVLETASQTVAQFQTTGQTKALTRYECVGDNPVFVGAARSDFNIEMGGGDAMTIDHQTKNVSLTGNVIFPNGKGINFGASQGGGATSDLLDDYEEGTWTPTWSAGLTSPSYVTQGGTYTKIGRLVTIHVAIETNGGTNNGAQVVMSGLPYTSSTTGRPGGVFMIYGNGLTAGSVNNPLQYIGGGVSTIRWYIDATGGAWLGTTQNGIANRAFNLVGSYYTDS